MYGGRFLSVESLENVFTQSLFGKNLCRHQPFDYDSEGLLSAEDPRPVKYQCLQNLIAHWAPKFMVDVFNDLVHKPGQPKDTIGNASVHTLTYKDPLQKIAPTISKHLDRYYNSKEKPSDGNGQNSFSQYKHLIEEEEAHDGIRDFIGIYKQGMTKEYWDKFENYFKLGLQASQHHIEEMIERSSKYPGCNIAEKHARSHLAN